jgi:anthranilate synthase component II
MTKVLVIDNYDSFTYNLVHLITALGVKDLTVWRNDKFELSQVEQFHKIVLSPGPGIPSEAGLMPEVVKRYHAQKPILGVCLGHQCIGEVFGGTLQNLKVPMHGKSSEIVLQKEDTALFEGLPKKFIVGRYHSWVVEPKSLPQCLEVTAIDDDGNIMAMRHKEFNVRGVQFHPESVMTDLGPKIIQNWLES